MKDIKIIIAAHKKYEMPKDEIYLPVLVGSDKNGKIDGYQNDNEGENISSKNACYCELTGMYWAWKNLDAEYIGLSHYRRHFTCQKRIPKEKEKKFDILLSGKEIEKILDKTDIVLPKKRKYYIENLYDHYKHTTYIETLDETRKVIEERYGEYLEEFDRLHKRTSAHMFNMFVMKKDLLDQYCTWLFDILFEVENRINPNKYDSFHARYPGRISELLLDVWINTNKLSYKEVKIIDIENINWWKKGITFLMSKFAKKKYQKSF